MKKNKECLTPFWNSSTHDVVINNICHSLGYKRCSLSVDPNYAWQDLIISLLVLFLYIPKILVLSLRDDIRKLKIFDVNIGRSINEESIAGSKSAVFKFNIVGYKKILRAILYYFQMKKKIHNNKIGLILGGDEAYMEMSIAAQLAEKKKIPAVFLKGGTIIKAFFYNSEYMNAFPLYENYPDMLNQLKDKENLVKKAGDMLEDRVDGNRSSLQYMPKYDSSKEHQNLYLSAVWIFLHDFYDSPGIYGGNIFQSHCHWLEYTIKALERYDVKVVIKRHPNERPVNIQIIENYKKRYKNSVVWCEEDISINRIKHLQCKAIFTVYGTVITEGTYSGIPVIAAGRSPYSGFDVCYRATNIKEYREYIHQIGIGYNLKPKRKEAAINAECANRFMDVPNFLLDIPYDDISKDLWESCGLGVYPEHNYERRKIFLKNKNILNYMENHLQNIDLASKLGIKKYSHSEYWGNR